MDFARITAVKYHQNLPGQGEVFTSMCKYAWREGGLCEEALDIQDWRKVSILILHDPLTITPPPIKLVCSNYGARDGTENFKYEGAGTVHSN
jgi:hypothetical protein